MERFIKPYDVINEDEHISVITLEYDNVLREFVKKVQGKFRDELRGIYRMTGDNIQDIIAAQREVRNYIMTHKDELTYVNNKGLSCVLAEETPAYGLAGCAKPDMFALFACVVSNVDSHSSFQECLDNLAKHFIGTKLEVDEERAAVAGISKCCCSNPCGPTSMTKMRNHDTQYAALIGCDCAKKYKIMTPEQYDEFKKNERRVKAIVKRKRDAKILAEECAADKLRYAPTMDRFRLSRIFAVWKGEVDKTKEQRETAQMTQFDIRWEAPIKIDDDTISEMTDDETDDTINVTTNEKADSGINNHTHEPGFISCQLCSKTMRAYKDFTTCFKCNQRKKSAKCVGCDAAFDDKGGLYNKCYNCSNNDKCDGCGKRFNGGGGKYTTCYKCKCSGTCRVCSQKFDNKNGKYTKCYNC